MKKKKAVSRRLKISFNNIYHSMLVKLGSGSSVSIANNYGLNGPGIESRWVEIFRRPNRAHPASCTMVTGSFP